MVGALAQSVSQSLSAYLEMCTGDLGGLERLWSYCWRCLWRRIEVALLVLLNSLLCRRTIPECGQLRASSGIGCRPAGCYGASSY